MGLRERMEKVFESHAEPPPDEEDAAPKEDAEERKEDEKKHDEHEEERRYEEVNVDTDREMQQKKEKVQYVPYVLKTKVFQVLSDCEAIPSHFRENDEIGEEEPPVDSEPIQADVEEGESESKSESYKNKSISIPPVSSEKMLQQTRAIVDSIVNTIKPPPDEKFTFEDLVSLLQKFPAPAFYYGQRL